MSSMCKLLRAQSMGGSAHSTISPWKLGKLSSWFRSPSYSHIELPSLAHQQGKPSSLMGSSAWTIVALFIKLAWMYMCIFLFIHLFIFAIIYLFLLLTKPAQAQANTPKLGLVRASARCLQGTSWASLGFSRAEPRAAQANKSN